MKKKISYKYLASLAFNLECEFASTPQNSRKSVVRSVRNHMYLFFP